MADNNAPSSEPNLIKNRAPRKRATPNYADPSSSSSERQRIKKSKKEVQVTPVPAPDIPKGI